jgi:hypothetical protein
MTLNFLISSSSVFLTSPNKSLSLNCLDNALNIGAVVFLSVNKRTLYLVGSLSTN